MAELDQAQPELGLKVGFEVEAFSSSLKFEVKVVVLI